ncbi:hypothetical protein [Candidatus Sulfurimonas baltica]|uniref:Uncharacterized protein n=1 Tax=Candidatus Sulfurimonas baltica TaxID=2740404 RepID=A0A7S7LXB4_9BACT|nr:hypothetical protein [Candidatus Sulfurimonas baltica]QOY52309.1 hypothetical protein HUE88_01040 [Candidatus Sulfurimonas baltica]
MIFILLLLLEDANEDAVDIFNKLDNDKKLLLLKLFKKIFMDEFNREIALYKKIHKAYEDKRVELSILHEFGVEQGYVNEASSFTDDIDYQIINHFKNVDNVENMDMDI